MGKKKALKSDLPTQLSIILLEDILQPLLGAFSEMKNQSETLKTALMKIILVLQNFPGTEVSPVFTNLQTAISKIVLKEVT